MTVAQLFLSGVSAEFGNLREPLRRDLSRADVSVAVQEDFAAGGATTLEKLDDYLSICDGVVHLVGDMTGAFAQPPSVAAIRKRYPDLGDRFPALAPFLADHGPGLPYTQWEAWLALYHGRRVIVCAPAADAPRDPRYAPDDTQRRLQRDHLARLAAIERHVEIRFADAARLAIEVLRSPLGDLVRHGGATRGNLPLRPNLYFSGRDALMRALAATLGPPPPAGRAAAVCVLSGLGGVGKSRLALEFAWAQAREHSALLFAAAADADALDRSLAALASPGVLDLPEHQSREQDERIGAVLRWLATHPGWLLIADNVDSEEAAAAVESRLAPLSGGQVLVTSRLGPERWGGSAALLRVDELDPADAAAFLLERTAGRRRPRDDDDDIALQLAGELGGLPLALEQAGAHVGLLRLTLHDYLQQWNHSRDRLLGWFDGRVMGYPRSVAATWQTSVARLSAPALRLLQRLSWLAPAAVPESLLAVRGIEPDPVADAGLAALAELAALSLVRRDDLQPRFGVHRLVQEVTRSGLAEPLRIELLAESLLWIDAAFQGDPWDVRSWPVLDPLLPHAEAVAGAADREGLGPAAAPLIDQAGRLVHAKALHERAEPLLRRALTLDEDYRGADDPEVATRLNNLAELLKDTNRPAEAEPLLRRALAIGEARLGAGHPKVATLLSNLAGLLLAANRLAEAEPLLRRALSVSEAALGAQHADVAIRLTNLAQLLKRRSRLADAEPLMRRALAIGEAQAGPDHPVVATRLSNLAQLLQVSQRPNEAEPLMRRALAIDEASFGAQHPTVAIDLSNLGALLLAADRPAEAEPLMRRALAIDEACFGTGHPSVGRDLGNLGELLRLTARAGEAEPLARRALQIAESSHGPDHPEVATSLNNLALLLLDTGRAAEAVPLLQRAHRVALAALGPDHPDTRAIGAHLAGLRPGEA
ncbi:MAG: tetratricopeptide repeat protein [Piscinibacter sp.]|uniref:tetratricopeptide repeat protein n=1 Tax=Piscinibacter TaxID=1114981 RepID=UPI000FDD243C|nr:MULTISPECIES: tetratricopeptide repeat protein [Piscinibacter]MCW5667986.1 tetratricopeptide repeat protein [Piscinibacter sp.]